MEYVLIRQDRVASDAVEECLQHALASGNHGSILLSFGLLGSIVSNGLLGRNWGNDESGIELHQAQT